MRDPQLIAHPVHVPGHCFGCGASEGPVIDTMVDLVGDGRIYLCVRTCLAQYARLAGFMPPEQVDELHEALGAAEGRVGALEAELVRERDQKVVSVSDMVGLIDRMREAPAGAPVVVERAVQSGPNFTLESSWPLCTETRVDGTPCTAEALPGRDVCLAHSKRKAAA